MGTESRRLLYAGNVLVDVTLEVPALPERGGDVVARRSWVAVGGGFNVMAAAVRQGLPAAYAGRHGSGPHGDLARSALAEAGIAVLQPPAPGHDTGVCVTLVDDGGERTFATSFGAEAELAAADLAGIVASPGDAVVVSGYALLHEPGAAALAAWAAAVADGVRVLLDPDPIVADIPPGRLQALMGRCDVVSANLPEAAHLTGAGEPAGAAAALAGRLPRAGAVAVVRAGADGCWWATAGGAPAHAPGLPAEAVDTTGAGDAHVGALLAALDRGEDLAAALRTANACAAIAVERRGPATAPDLAETRRRLSTGAPT